MTNTPALTSLFPPFNPFFAKRPHSISLKDPVPVRVPTHSPTQLVPPIGRELRTADLFPSPFGGRLGQQLLNRIDHQTDSEEEYLERSAPRCTAVYAPWDAFIIGCLTENTDTSGPRSFGSSATRLHSDSQNSSLTRSIHSLSVQNPQNPHPSLPVVVGRDTGEGSEIGDVTIVFRKCSDSTFGALLKRRSTH